MMHQVLHPANDGPFERDSDVALAPAAPGTAFQGTIPKIVVPAAPSTGPLPGFSSGSGSQAISPTKPVRILAICDEVDKRLYGTGIEAKRGQFDLLLSCGDLPAYYIDYVASMLSVPTFGIHGNHDGTLARNQHADGDGADWGMIELHGRTVMEQGLLIGGFDGSLRYNRGSYQFTEGGMRNQILGMVPQLLLNRARYDQEDRPHQGFKVFRWFLKTFRPRYHLHGHIHIYNNKTITRTRFHKTDVINVYPYRELQVWPNAEQQQAASLGPA
jgi:uncharacterized protein